MMRFKKCFFAMHNIVVLYFYNVSESLGVSPIVISDVHSEFVTGLL